MDYNKLMAELDKEVLGSFESIQPQKSLSATEGYDDVEKDLMEELNDRPPIVEVEGEEDLIFDEDDSSEDQDPDEVFSKKVKEYFESLLEEGLEVEKAVEKVLSLVNSVLPDGDSDENGSSSAEVQETSAEEEIDTAVEKEANGGEIVTDDNYTEDPEKQKEIVDNTVKQLSEKMDMGSATESTSSSASFEEYQREKEAKMLNRYKQLANKDIDKKKVAIEGLGEPEISIDDQAISRVSGEYGYSGKNLRKMVAEAIQKGVI